MGGAALETIADTNAKELEEEKRLEVINNLAKLRRENYNMVCYGLPDIYMWNNLFYFCANFNLIN